MSVMLKERHLKSEPVQCKLEVLTLTLNNSFPQSLKLPSHPKGTSKLGLVSEHVAPMEVTPSGPS